MRIFILLFIGFFSFSAWSQCPPGIPNNPGCIPPDVFYGSAPNTDPPPLPSDRWVTRWAAIAVGDTDSGGGFGASRAMPSKRKAQKEALSLCKQSGGGKECKIFLVYHNQCGAVVWGDTYFHLARASKKDEAESLAAAGCAEKTDNCKIFYSDCTYPAKVY